MTNKTSWILDVQEDPATGDSIIVFPPDLLETAGWAEGDVLQWIDRNDGTWELKLKDATMSKLSKLSKVNESFTVNRYDNGYMVEVSGRDSENDWKTSKIMCGTREELFDVITEALDMEKDD
jgi:bifunctional DNA-binding transcriptional regulator/antitoxin component of YhaV-PrlF toxin-antitoxin module